MNVTEFRKDISKHLDTALQEPVYVERGGVTFVLVSNIAPKGVQASMRQIEAAERGDAAREAAHQPDSNAGQFTPITPKKNTAEAAPQKRLIVAAEGGGEEQACCAKAAPCKHWAYNGETQTWRNVLSGRVKEVEV